MPVVAPFLSTLKSRVSASATAVDSMVREYNNSVWLPAVIWRLSTRPSSDISPARNLADKISVVLVIHAPAVPPTPTAPNDEDAAVPLLSWPAISAVAPTALERLVWPLGAVCKLVSTFT